MQKETFYSFYFGSRCTIRAPLAQKGLTKNNITITNSVSEVLDCNAFFVETEGQSEFN